MAARAAIASLTKLSATRLSSAPRLSITATSSFQTCAAPARRLPESCRRAFSASAASLEKKYSEDHEWVEIDTDGVTGTIGISTYAAKALGDVVYVELPAIDSDISKGDTIGAVESVKSASDILAPCSGKVLETNSMLEEKPGSINKSPEGEAWICRVKVGDTSELDGLMDKEAYATFTAEEK